MRRDAQRGSWHGGPHVLALLFAHPDSDSMRLLRARHAYFDHRTSDTWDLFFPGYYPSAPTAPIYDDRVVAHEGSERWVFDPLGFNILRNDVEVASAHRWRYSGGADLVLASCWLPEDGEPVLDWASVKSGALTEPGNERLTLSLNNVVELISRDLEQALEDSDFGVSATVGTGPPPGDDSAAKKVMIGALGGIAAALGERGLGL